jgi:acyl carrier protein phosphodiesterase
MNFLAHLWLTERARLPLAGAILGDVLHGALPAHMPPALARAVRYHRIVDAHTDRHPRVALARAGFPPGARRFAGIVLDLVFDHALARDWDAFSAEPLAQFADRAGRAVQDGAAWFEHAGDPAPDAARFSVLLQSYASEAGLERAIRRTASRLRLPDGLLRAAEGWRERLARLRDDLPVVLADLEHVWAAHDTSGVAPRPDQGLM